MADRCPYMSNPGESAGRNDDRRFYEEEGISLRELLLVLVRGKKTIALVAMAVFLLTVIGAAVATNIHIGTKGTVETAVQLYFSGIEVGQTPTGGYTT